jgi:hypothetical protein
MNAEDLAEYYHYHELYQAMREKFQQEKKLMYLHKESCEEIDPFDGYKAQTSDSIKKDEMPYQYVWNEEAKLENILSKTSNKVGDDCWRSSYGSYMEKIGKAAENLLASFDITKRRTIPSSCMYSSLWESSDIDCHTSCKDQFKCNTANVVDPWAEPDMWTDVAEATFGITESFSAEVTSKLYREFPSYSRKYYGTEYMSQVEGYGSSSQHQMKVPVDDEMFYPANARIWQGV